MLLHVVTRGAALPSLVMVAALKRPSFMLPYIALPLGTLKYTGLRSGKAYCSILAPDWELTCGWAHVYTRSSLPVVVEHHLPVPQTRALSSRVEI
jgi:hypothetical protein